MLQDKRIANSRSTGPVPFGFAVFLKSDTTWVDLKDYFLYPEKIKKITPLAGVKLYWDKTASTLGVIAGDSGVLLSGMNIRYEGYDYQIPVMRPNPDAGFYIGTDEVRGDTFFYRVPLGNRLGCLFSKL